MTHTQELKDEQVLTMPSNGQYGRGERGGDKKAGGPRVFVCECIHVSVSVRACTFAYVCMPAYVCDALEKGQGG